MSNFIACTPMYNCGFGKIIRPIGGGGSNSDSHLFFRIKHSSRLFVIIVGTLEISTKASVNPESTFGEYISGFGSHHPSPGPAISSHTAEGMTMDTSQPGRVPSGHVSERPGRGDGHGCGATPAPIMERSHGFYDMGGPFGGPPRSSE